MNAPFETRRITNGFTLLACFALIKLAIHLITNIWGGYGIFRDELYYVACSNHLDIGYVDQPPLSLYVLALIRFLLGDSIFALRLVPAIAGACTVFLTGLIARELGGKTWAQTLACTASIASLINLAYDSVYNMNAIDLVFWAWAAFIAVRLMKTGDKKYWLQLGITLGLGALNKINMLWFGGGIFLGLLLTSYRMWFRTRWPWIAGLIVFLLFLPYIVWNFRHDFAHLEFIRNATLGKYAGLSPITFAIGQFFLQNLVTLPLWLSGLYFLLIFKEGRQFAPLGIVYLVSFAILVLNGHSKSEYLAPAYAMLFAGGGVGVERWFEVRFRMIRPLYLFILWAGLLLAPLTLPILPVETYINYSEALGVKPSTAEAKELDKLPQYYADMFGWEDKAAAVAKVYHRLSPEEQKTCALFGDNYGRSGAIDYYSGKYHLPPAIGRHNNYWIWGPRDYTGELVIILGGNLQDKQQRFESVEIADTVTSAYCMPYENNLRIYLCRKLNVPLRDFWPEIKVFE